jgi:hypothetical protein
MRMRCLQEGRGGMSRFIRIASTSFRLWLRIVTCTYDMFFFWIFPLKEVVWHMNLRAVNDTADIISAESLTPRRRRVTWAEISLDLVVVISAVSLTPRK